MVTGVGDRRTSKVYLCNLGGDSAHPITFGPGNYELEAVLHNGRLLLSAEWPLTEDGASAGERTLFTIRPDGSGLTLVRDTLAQQASVGGGRELANGALLFVESRLGGGLTTVGRLAQLRPGTLRASILPLRAGVDASAAEMPGNSLLIARRSGAASGRRFDLYSVNLSGMEGSLFYSDPHSSSVEPVRLGPRPAPEVYWSILHPEADTGRLVCLDAYFTEDAHGGRLGERIAAVRVVTLDVSSGRQLVLGEAPVESDGSFYTTVPANTPIRFQLVGTQGKLLREQRSWIWVRNGEDRGCLGCHESKSSTPPNHSPLALQRPGPPPSLAGPMHARSATAPVGNQ